MDLDSNSRISQLVERVGEGQAQATTELLPLLYAELRKLARARLARERSAHGHQPTSLVHEVYLRLVGDREMRWANRSHFFAAAAEAMRRILIERARSRARLKRGGDRKRVTLDDGIAITQPRDEDLLALDAALDQLEELDPTMSTVVKLRYFAGLTVPETAQALQLSERTINRQWAAARAWLHCELGALGH